ncbi:3-phosphoinositide-dependent protein kinase 1 [Tanacetum coccineum]|uniref:3-phosphoinositide-dependent protein kinase 1 n=1 Tax=Tanacetum coccineum TaxID=301880 RepID=A0ABQ5GIM5_9ASTR
MDFKILILMLESRKGKETDDVKDWGSTSLEMLGAPASGKGYTTTQASLNRRAVDGIRLHNNRSREGFTKTKSGTLRCKHVSKNIKPPENLLFTSDGHIKIADFGSVKPMQDSRITVVPNAASGIILCTKTKHAKPRIATPTIVANRKSESEIDKVFDGVVQHRSFGICDAVFADIEIQGRYILNLIKEQERGCHSFNV